MNRFATLVKTHAARYPLMQPCDSVKLLYQHEFGGGHLVTQEKESLIFLEREYSNLFSRETMPLLEEIGNGYERLYLSAISSEQLPLPCFHKIFVESSAITNGTWDDFRLKLDVLRRLAREGVFSFSAEDLAHYLKGYKQKEYPIVSHSNVYRTAYHPAYRVISTQYALLLPVIYAINRSFCEKERVVLAIDGNSAAGKTTAAQLLRAIFDASIIHMDDFFLPPQLRTEERYEQPGGNIHYERFEQEVLLPLLRGKPFAHRVFDCKTSSYSGIKAVDPAPLTIIEGAYSLHPRFADSYDLKLFLSISPAEQKRRILKRNGEDGFTDFCQRWIPLENRYFDAYSIRQGCDICIPSAKE